MGHAQKAATEGSFPVDSVKKNGRHSIWKAPIGCSCGRVLIKHAFHPTICGPCSHTYWWYCEFQLESSHLGVVGRLLDNFGSHPERCTHKRLPLDLRVCQLTSHTKVSQFHLTMLRQQDVGSWRESSSLCQIIDTNSSYNNMKHETNWKLKARFLIQKQQKCVILICVCSKRTCYCIMNTIPLFVIHDTGFFDISPEVNNPHKLMMGCVLACVHLLRHKFSTC